MSFTETPPPVELAMRRKKNPQTSMFLRMLVRAAVLRRGRALSALLAVVVAAAAATAMLNLYVDVQAKLQREFRNYGANVIVMAKAGEKLPAGALDSVRTALAGRGIAVPFGYVIARTAEGQSVVVAGTDFQEVRKLNDWWAVTNWPQQVSQALVGTRAEAVVSPQGKPFTLSFEGRTITLSPAGTVHTGAAEDSRIYISLDDFTHWTGLSPSTIEVAVSGSTPEIAAAMQKLAQTLPAADVRPVRQIVEGQAHVLGKTRSTLLFAAILIILTAALCVLSTLIGWVSDRRRDFAIMKALGASGRLLNTFFAAEAAMLGLVGSVIGYGIGVGAAIWIGRVNFHASVDPRFGVLPIVVLGSVAVALLASLIPISLLRRVQPAMILRGE